MTIGRSGICCAALVAVLCFAPAARAAEPRAVRKALKMESVAVPARVAQATVPFFFRDTRSEEWHLCAFAYALNRVDYLVDPPSQFLDVNLTTGRARLVACVPGRSVQSRVMLHSNGRLYAGSGRPNHLFEYDPTTGKGRDLGKITDAFYNETNIIAEGPDGSVRVHTSGGDAATWDPKTGTLTRMAAKDLELKPPAESPILKLADAEKPLGMVFDLSGLAPTGRNGGALTVRWRKRDADAWRTATVKGVGVRANSTRLLTALPDGTLMGVTSLYTPFVAVDPKTGASQRAVTLHGPFFTLDPKTAEVTIIGRMPYKPTGLVAVGDKVYMAHGRAILVYDRTKPWTYTSAEPLGGAAPNPAVATQTGMLPIAAVRLSAQAQHKRDASVTVLLPKLNEVFGVKRDRKTDGEGNITWSFIVTRQKPDADAPTYTRTYAGRAFSGMEKYDLNVHAQELVIGPDGCGWLFVDRDLCRIHPTDGRIEKVMEQCDVAGRLLFAGDDLYLYNGGRLFFDIFADIRRIKNVFAD